MFRSVTKDSVADMIDASLLAKLDRAVPRYTSYPTAPHFSPSVAQAAQAAWLAAIPQDSPLSLYLHVPFCDQLCFFCGCNTAVVRRDALKYDYAEQLIHEIRTVGAHLGTRRPVAHIHWGGGTPTALPADALVAVAAAIRESFLIRDSAEIAVEIDPRTLDDSRIAALAEIGVNRASLGVQDFDPAVQRAIGRIQDFAMTRRCVDSLRAIGIASINLDILYGLPFQTVESARRTAEMTLALAPDRIAAFGYAHVPWMKKHQNLIPEAALPDAPERFAQRAAIDETFTAAGYHAIALDHYARADDSLALAAAARTVGRNFQGYTTDPAEILIGLGASAISTYPQGYLQNITATADYAKAIRRDGLAATRGIEIDATDRLRRDVINALMCGFSADLQAISAAHGVAPTLFASEVARLDEHIADGLATWDGKTVRVTTVGQPFVRVIAAVFDTYLNPAGQRHSRAV